MPWTVICQASLSIGSLQARIVQWVAMTSSRGFSQPRSPALRADSYHLSCQGSPRILPWLAYLFSVGTFWPRNQTRFSCTASGCFTSWASREAQNCLRSNNTLAPPVLLAEARIKEKDWRKPYFVHKVLYNLGMFREHPQWLPGEIYLVILSISFWASLVAQKVKNLPPRQGIWVWSLGQEALLEKGTTLRR